MLVYVRLLTLGAYVYVLTIINFGSTYELYQNQYGSTIYNNYRTSQPLDSLDSLSSIIAVVTVVIPVFSF